MSEAKTPAAPCKWESDSNNPFNLVAMGRSEIKTLAIGGQSLTRAGSGASRILGFAAAGLLLADGIAVIAPATFGVVGSSFGAASSGLLGSTLSALPMVGAFPPVAIVGGVMIAAYFTHKMLFSADKKLSNITKTPPMKDAWAFNPVAGVVNTFESVGLVGRFGSRFFKTKGNLAILAATGLAAVEIGGAYLGITSAGAVTGAALSTVAGWGSSTLVATSGLPALAGLGSSIATATAGVASSAALPAIAAIGAIALIGFGVSRLASGIDGGIANLFKGSPAKGAAPSPA